MKNRRIIFLAACMCSVVFLSGCSTDSLMDKMMGTETTVSSSASVDISKEDSDAVHVDANLEKPIFSVNPVESLQIPVGNTSGKLTCEAGITGEGTVTYQWYKNNVNSNGGGTPIEGATEVTYQVDTSAEGKDYYYVVATNTVGNTVSMARAEAKRRMSEYNSILADQGYTLIDRNRPYDQETQSISFAANLEPDLKSARRERAIIFIILLLVPAINLSSMTQSRLRQRVAEIGVRRAFGSTRMEMVGQIIMENLVVTLLAGAVGLFISIVMAYLGTDILFAQPYSATLNAPTVDSSILLHPSTFLYALLFCFVLNLLSSGIPAWRASRTSIVNALGGRIH